MGSYYSAYIPHNGPDDIARNMRRIGLNRICVCTLELGSTGESMLHNKRVASAVARYPELLSGYATLNGNRKDTLYRQLLDCEKMGLHLGIKLHVYRQEYDITGDYLIPVFQRLNERNAVVLNHWFPQIGITEALVKAYPAITFIQGHPHEGLMPLAVKYENFYMCTCASLAYDHIREITARIGSEKLLYGSDYGVLDAAFGYGPVVFASINDREKQNILGLNMKRIIDRVINPGV
jgi:predicted TIM-barrel fold metal-dependent hydrolase